MTDLTSGPIPVDLGRPQELLAYVSYRLGYHPSNCLVTLPLHEAPEEAVLGSLTRVPCSVLRAGRRPPGAGVGAGRRAVAIIYHGELFDLLAGAHQEPAAHRSAKELLAAVASAVDGKLFDPTWTFVVGPEAWRCLACHAPGHCPPAGHPRATLEATTVAAAMVVRGFTLLTAGQQRRLLPPPTAPQVADPRVEALLEALTRRGRLPRAGPWRTVEERRWRAALAGPAHGWGDAQRALLGLSLHDVDLRDNVIYAVSTGRRLPPVTGDPSHFNAMFTRAAAPDLPHLSAKLGLLATVAAACPIAFRAPILSVLAWGHWWARQYPQANILLDAAREHDPDYSLARILSQLLSNAMAPPWRRAPML